MNQRDAEIEKIIEKIVLIKKEIETGKKPALQTNCVLQLPGQPSRNIRTIGSVDEAVALVKLVLSDESLHNDACVLLGVADTYGKDFKIGNFTVDEWVHDIKCVCDQIVAKEKLAQLNKDLKTLESKISTDRKDQKELDDIFKKY